MTALLEAWARLKTPEGRARVDAELATEAGAARTTQKKRRRPKTNARRGRVRRPPRSAPKNAGWTASTITVTHHSCSIHQRSPNRREREEAAQAARSQSRRGPLRVDRRRTLRFRGRVLGDVHVGPSARLELVGRIEGDLHVEGGVVLLVGDLEGELIARSGTVEIIGRHRGGVAFRRGDVRF
jgi:cytoskeletal protein CcmA (bactofilin family)